MKESEIQQFWREKEKEHQGQLVRASFARYLDGYPFFPEAANGLLYLMTNGVYFENFPKEHWLDKVTRRKEDFTRMFLRLKSEQITDVSCFTGQKDKFNIPLGKRLASLFGVLPRLLLVGYHTDEGTGVVRFTCTESPFSLCAAFYRECALPHS